MFTWETTQNRADLTRCSLQTRTNRPDQTKKLKIHFKTEQTWPVRNVYFRPEQTRKEGTDQSMMFTSWQTRAEQNSMFRPEQTRSKQNVHFRTDKNRMFTSRSETLIRTWPDVNRPKQTGPEQNVYFRLEQTRPDINCSLQAQKNRSEQTSPEHNFVPSLCFQSVAKWANLRDKFHV